MRQERGIGNPQRFLEIEICPGTAEIGFRRQNVRPGGIGHGGHLGRRDHHLFDRVAGRPFAGGSINSKQNLNGNPRLNGGGNGGLGLEIELLGADFKLLLIGIRKVSRFETVLRNLGLVEEIPSGFVENSRIVIGQ